MDKRIEECTREICNALHDIARIGGNGNELQMDG